MRVLVLGGDLYPIQPPLSKRIRARRETQRFSVPSRGGADLSSIKIILV
jgi:hypothetical protein